MKRLLVLLILIPLVFAVESEINDFIVISSSSPTSVEIKDIVRGDLIREYGKDYFTVDSSDLPKVNDVPFLSFNINDKVITITPEELVVDNNLIKPTEFTLYTPYTNYLLSKNLRVYPINGILILEDDDFKIKTEEVNVKDGIVYLHKSRVPIKIMPYMITYKFRELTGDKIEQMEIYSTKDGLEYKYKLKLNGKLFYFMDKQIDSYIIVDAVKGTIKVDKPWWAIFSSGENKLLDGLDITEYYGY